MRGVHRWDASVLCAPECPAMRRNGRHAEYYCMRMRSLQAAPNPQRPRYGTIGVT